MSKVFYESCYSSSRCIFRSYAPAVHCFSTHGAAQASSNKRSPTVKRQQKVKAREPQANTTHTPRSSNMCPPLSILLAARRAGLIDIEPSAVSQLIVDYTEAYDRKGPSWERRFVIDNNITPSTLTTLGRILTNMRSPIQKTLGKRMMYSASALGCPRSTISIMRAAHRDGRAHEPDNVLSLVHLKELASQNHAKALVLLGKIKLEQGKEGDAMELFRRAASLEPSAMPASPTDDTAAGPADIAEGLIEQAQLLQKRQQPEEALAHFRTAAIDYDHPVGYYYLGIAEASESQQEVNFAKAAGAGHMSAAVALGQLYEHRARAMNADLEDLRLPAEDQLAMSKEWYFLAATAGNGNGMLAMGLSLKDEGKKDAGLAWINRALGVPEVEAKAKSMIESW